MKGVPFVAKWFLLVPNGCICIIKTFVLVIKTFDRGAMSDVFVTETFDRVALSDVFVTKTFDRGALSDVFVTETFDTGVMSDGFLTKLLRLVENLTVFISHLT